MTYIPTEVFADLIERWIARGRALDAAWDEEGVRRVMRYGVRYRVRGVIGCAIFGLACLAAVAVEIAGMPLGFWVRLAYACFVFPVFLVSVFHAVSVCLTSVVLSDAGVAICTGFVAVQRLEWSSVSSVRHSSLGSNFVIEGVDGTRLRIPTQMDGVRTLCDFLITRVDMARIDRSVPIAMAKLI